MYTPDEILILARAWAEAKGYSLATVGRRIFGFSNTHIFNSLAKGRDCRARALLKASKWFNENWPENVPWPLPYKKLI